MKTKTIVTASKDVGQRLDKWLMQDADIISRSYAQDLIHKNHVLVDDVSVKASHILKINQQVSISIPDVISAGLLPYDFKLNILHEDSHIIVLNKPSGLVVHPAAGHQQDTLVNALINHTTELSMKNERRPGIVHRLDKETSGLLVVAKNDVAHEALSAQFKNRTTHRTYYAVAEKELHKDSGTIQSYLARHPVDRKRYASVRINNRVIQSPKSEMTDGKWAVTQFKKLSCTRLDKNLTLTYLQLKLETGRTHQIRVHMSEYNHPLFGDLTYGASHAYHKKYSLNRFFLHAAELGFEHPNTQEKLLFKVPWPQQDSVKLKEFGFDHALPGI